MSENGIYFNSSLKPTIGVELELQILDFKDVLKEFVTSFKQSIFS